MVAEVGQWSGLATGESGSGTLTIFRSSLWVLFYLNIGKFWTVRLILIAGWHWFHYQEVFQSILFLPLWYWRWRLQNWTHRAATFLVPILMVFFAQGLCQRLPPRVTRCLTRCHTSHNGYKRVTLFLGSGWSETYPGLESHLLTLVIQFLVPGHRELVYWSG